jgi:hypothetical protein
MRGVDGDDSAAKAAAIGFDALLVEAPDDLRIRAYVGSARLLAARAATVPWDKLKLSKQGLEQLDAALAARPDDVELRWLRGVSSWELPAFFSRRAQSTADLSAAAERVDAAYRDGAIDLVVAAAIWYYRGRDLRRSGDRPSAETCWRKAIGLGPETPGALSARAALASKD